MPPRKRQRREGPNADDEEEQSATEYDAEFVEFGDYDLKFRANPNTQLRKTLNHGSHLRICSTLNFGLNEDLSRHLVVGDRAVRAVEQELANSTPAGLHKTTKARLEDRLNKWSAWPLPPDEAIPPNYSLQEEMEALAERAARTKGLIGPETDLTQINFLDLGVPSGGLVLMKMLDEVLWRTLQVRSYGQRTDRPADWKTILDAARTTVSPQ